MEKDLKKIDLVYLWVDSSDEAWQKRKREYDKLTNSCDKDSVADCRFIDNDELKYSLRSVEKNLSWINKIFIITDNQIPSWLNLDNDKIRIINHTEIIPRENLPLFNSCAIETRIPYIEELSEYFIYANDDMFFWSPLVESDFFEGEKPIYQVGKRILNKKYKHLYGNTVVRAFNLVKEKFGCNAPYFSHHNPDPYRKSLCLRCESEFKEEYKNTLNNRFRDFSDIQRSVIMYYSISQKEAIFRKNVNNLFSKIFFKKSPMSMAITTEPTNIRKIKNTNSKLLCLNDSRKTTANSRKLVRQILEEKFTQKSVFEK